MRIYLDVCCLCRPFDNFQQEKIALEANAVLAILDRCLHDWELIGSVVIDDEISFIPDIEKRLKVEQKLYLINEYIEYNESVFEQATRYMKMGLKHYDALHLACAQSGEALLLTTDNKLVTISRKIPDLSIRVENPLIWLMEVLDNENNQ
jgi:hypothetical protein